MAARTPLWGWHRRMRERTSRRKAIHTITPLQWVDDPCFTCTGRGWIVRREPNGQYRVTNGLYRVTCPTCHGQGHTSRLTEANQ